MNDGHPADGKEKRFSSLLKLLGIREKRRAVCMTREDCWCSEEWCAGWSKEYREMDETKLLETVTEYMENWLMIQCKEEQVVIRPAAGRLAGVYPDDFKGGTKE